MTLLYKYTPTSINDMILDKSIKERFALILRNFTNLIISGSIGVGKTTIATCLVNDIFKNDIKNVLYINSINGLKNIYTSIMTFCHFHSISKYPYKIVVINDIDNITEKIQNQISLLMEKYQYTVKFIFTCETIVNIIQQIQSKSLIIGMVFPLDSQIISYVQHICDNEQIKYEDDAITQIVNNYHGDIRTILNTVQILSKKIITTKRLYNLCGTPQTDLIKEILELCFSNDLYSAIMKTKTLKNLGFSGTDIVTSMLNVLQSNFELYNDRKMEMLSKICDTIYNMSCCIDSDLQLFSLICELST